MLPDKERTGFQVTPKDSFNKTSPTDITHC